ncbi:unnamed protein product [Caenorhabditis brenneri]
MKQLKDSNNGRIYLIKECLEISVSSSRDAMETMQQYCHVGVVGQASRWKLNIKLLTEEAIKGGMGNLV